MAGAFEEQIKGNRSGKDTRAGRAVHARHAATRMHPSAHRSACCWPIRNYLLHLSLRLLELPNSKVKPTYYM